MFSGLALALAQRRGRILWDSVLARRWAGAGAGSQYISRIRPSIYLDGPTIFAARQHFQNWPSLALCISSPHLISFFWPILYFNPFARFIGFLVEACDFPDHDQALKHWGAQCLFCLEFHLER